MTVADADDRSVTDWSTLHTFAGRSFPDSDLLGYFGQSPEEIPVAILLESVGHTRILATADQTTLLAQTSVRASRLLVEAELELIQKHVEGQWADGWGAALSLDDCNFFIQHEQVACSQIDDGIASLGSGTRDLFPAILARDTERVRQALAQGENVRALIGGTNALGWAFYQADATIAHLLLDAGVDVNLRAHGFMTTIASCALSLPDPEAAAVTRRLLEKGTFESHELDYAAEIAGTNKPLLLAVLNEYRNA